eukprot:Sspe_Gene.63051::Locus_35801_Transcript_1_6_Confidence_0.182_Length_1351::g.63051::m.63051
MATNRITSFQELQAKKKVCGLSLHRGQPAVQRSQTQAPPPSDEPRRYTSARELAQEKTHHMTTFSQPRAQRTTHVDPTAPSPARSYEEYASQKRKHMVGHGLTSVQRSNTVQPKPAPRKEAPPQPVEQPARGSAARASFSELAHDRRHHAYQGKRPEPTVQETALPQPETSPGRCVSARALNRQKKLHKVDVAYTPPVPEEEQPQNMDPRTSHKRLSVMKKYHVHEMNVHVDKGPESSSADPTWSYSRMQQEKKHHHLGFNPPSPNPGSQRRVSCTEFNYDKVRHRADSHVPEETHTTTEQGPLKSNTKLREDKKMCRHTIDDHVQHSATASNAGDSHYSAPIKSYTELEYAKRHHRHELDGESRRASLVPCDA